MFELFPWGFKIGEKVYKTPDDLGLTEDQKYTIKPPDSNKQKAKKFTIEGVNTQNMNWGQILALRYTKGNELLQKILEGTRNPSAEW